ncbi:hypothetical protein OX90_11890 [Pseudomonas coronafaciens pv. porri]|uniref:XRE family transcriptional regulator n=1 Tax=Pseudomonas coronafaciens pv. porri TaxID=83964 RepID=A0ABR5JPN1_9PSED|nr:MULTISPECIES: hypothetical protein [Pseudomonas syringae group]KOP57599.1 hypothetical protein OX88_04565 [Pseudomonas coronafaciens pv. porri]KOP59342.1 hypothetical protein OX90_11890 [Pseudomonas coronafaciens pv. porri]MCH5514642.1 hypothetical protein [Pseudomonas syringae pv. syringae]
MTIRSPIASEDVMNAFAMDYEPGTDVLRRYLADYPQYATDLVDLARELSRQVDEDLPLSADELAAVNAKMGRLRDSIVTVEFLQSAPSKIFAKAAGELGLPIQVGVAIRERRIDSLALPERFLARLAKALNASVSVVQSFLVLPAQASALRANKSDDKPLPAEKVPLELLLKESGLDEESISRILQDDD